MFQKHSLTLDTERLFILKILSCTHWAMEVKKFVEISLKPLRSKLMALFDYP